MNNWISLDHGLPKDWQNLPIEFFCEEYGRFKKPHEKSEERTKHTFETLLELATHYRYVEKQITPKIEPFKEDEEEEKIIPAKKPSKKKKGNAAKS